MTNSSRSLWSLLFGFAAATVAMTPILSIMLRLNSEPLYLGAMCIAVASGAMGFIRNRAPFYRMSAVQAAMFVLFLMAAVHVPYVDAIGSQAVVSLGICALLAIILPGVNVSEAQRGLLIGIAVFGVAAGIYSSTNPAFAFARSYGYSQERLFYLLFAAAVSASIAPILYLSIRGKGLLRRLFLAAVTGALLIALVMSLGRVAVLAGILGALLTAAIATGAFATAGRRSSNAIRVALGVVVTIMIVVATLGQSNVYLASRYDRLLQIDTELSVGRGRLWSEATRLIEQSPVLGHGLLSTEQELGIYPHNIVLEAWADFGIAGLVVLFAMYVGLALGLRKGLRLEIAHGQALLYVAALIYALEGLKSGSLYYSRAFFILLTFASSVDSALVPHSTTVAKPRVEPRT